MILANMVFPGTVLGPPLWNVFFADVAVAARQTGGSENVFADDLNVFIRFNAVLPNHTVVKDMNDFFLFFYAEPHQSLLSVATTTAVKRVRGGLVRRERVEERCGRLGGENRQRW